MTSLDRPLLDKPQAFHTQGWAALPPATNLTRTAQQGLATLTQPAAARGTTGVHAPRQLGIAGRQGGVQPHVRGLAVWHLLVPYRMNLLSVWSTLAMRSRAAIWRMSPQRATLSTWLSRYLTARGCACWHSIWKALRLVLTSCSEDSTCPPSALSVAVPQTRWWEGLGGLLLGWDMLELEGAA